MTPAEFRAWRNRHKLSKIKAAEEVLGCGRNSITRWEAGKSPIPRYIALACAAYSQGVPPMGSLSLEQERKG